MSNLPKIFSSIYHFFMMACSPCVETGHTNKPGVELITNCWSKATLMGFQDLWDWNDHVTIIRSCHLQQRKGIQAGHTLTVLTILPSPDPKSTRFPFRPLSSFITLSTWVLLAGMYGTWKIYFKKGSQHRNSTENILWAIHNTCNFNGTFRKPGWRTPTHMAYTASPVPAAICASPHPPIDPVLSSAKASFGASSSILQLLLRNSRPTWI